MKICPKYFLQHEGKKKSYDKTLQNSPVIFGIRYHDFKSKIHGGTWDTVNGGEKFSREAPSSLEVALALCHLWPWGKPSAAVVFMQEMFGLVC